MRILTREEFFKLPPGAVFATYQPCCFGESLDILHEFIQPREGKISQSDCGDFYSRAIAGEISLSMDDRDESNTDPFFRAESEPVPIHFNTIIRDGMYDYEQQFAVWERTDILNLIAALQDLCKPGGPYAARRMKAGEDTLPRTNNPAPQEAPDTPARGE